MGSVESDHKDWLTNIIEISGTNFSVEDEKNE